MTYNRHRVWPVMQCVHDAGGTDDDVAQGNARCFYLPPDITTSDKLRVRFWGYTNGTSDTGIVVKIGNNEEPSGNSTNSTSKFKEFSSAVSSTTSFNVGKANIKNATLCEELITCTSEMVTHASNGDGFSLALCSETNNVNVYCQGIAIELEYAK